MPAFRTERFKTVRNTLVLVASATPRYPCKVRRQPFRKTIQHQSLTRTVLNPRSREVWRQTGREREMRAAMGSAQCGGFCAKPVDIGDFSVLKAGGECW